ncbi:hypothetical protein JAAARDRAFT_191790 [Jaapia argillacea MUCL 33604]|uniref:WH1 domain-containing protein n=1 Tax=Jaapia argillacea MUCL 33604 TaxID=933084 RepID=A0A067QA61_9AGAM|nr:hypothetical protein JAAARDRAFT_191790 [Jaapia argillacea MUCL 33604]
MVEYVESELSSVLQAKTYKIISTAHARVYHAPFGSAEHEWTYSGLKGSLVFGRDLETPADGRAYWFRLLDPTAKRKVVWAHHLPESFEYKMDKPFFHVFSGNSRMYGFRFEEDEEAGKFYEHVKNRAPPSNLPPRKKSRIFRVTRTPTGRSISPPLPDSFVHVAHIGLDDNGTLKTSDDLDPDWIRLLSELNGQL